MAPPAKIPDSDIGISAGIAQAFYGFHSDPD
jgi:hypothetical protein